MYKLIYLYWDNYDLGALTYIKNKYVFIKDDENYKNAEYDGCPIDFIGLGSEVYDDLPFIFEEFEIRNNRSDLVKKYNILDSDNRFDRLYKRALGYKNFNNDGFWIKAICDD